MALAKSLGVSCAQTPVSIDSRHWHASKCLRSSHERLAEGESLNRLNGCSRARNHWRNYTARGAVIWRQISNRANKTRAKSLVDVWIVFSYQGLYRADDLQDVLPFRKKRPDLLKEPLLELRDSENVSDRQREDRSLHRMERLL